MRSLGTTVKSSSPLTTTRESSRAATKTQCNQKLKKKKKRVIKALHSWHAQQAMEEQRASWRRVFTHNPPLRFTSSQLLAWPGPQGYAQAVFPGRFSLGLCVCIGKEAGCLISTPDAKIKTAVNWPRGGTWLDVYLGQSHFALLSLLLSLMWVQSYFKLLCLFWGPSHSRSPSRQITVFAGPCFNQSRMLWKKKEQGWGNIYLSQLLWNKPSSSVSYPGLAAAPSLFYLWEEGGHGLVLSWEGLFGAVFFSSLFKLPILLSPHSGFPQTSSPKVTSLVAFSIMFSFLKKNFFWFLLSQWDLGRLGK